MRTEHLIEFLVRGGEPAPRTAHLRRLAVTLVCGLALAVALIVFGPGVREDFMDHRMPVMWKSLFSAAAAAAALPLTVRLMRPGRPLEWRIAAVLAFAGLAALTAFIALMGEAPEQRMQAWLGGEFPWCIVLVPLLAAPTAALLVALMRVFAPTRLTLTGAAIGAAAGGIGAMAYSMFCPVDSIAFVTTWYVVAIGFCAALGAILGTRLLRW